jgi:putative membrane protein
MVNAAGWKPVRSGAPFRRTASCHHGAMTPAPASVLSSVPAGPWWSSWALEPFTVAAILAAGSLYGIGLVRAVRSGTQVRLVRRVAWFAGLGVLAVALVSPIDVYADVSFSIHMVQHLLLTLVAPPLLALGAPVTLALRAMSARAARGLARVLRSAPVRVLTSPVVAWSLFVGTPWALHYSPLFDLALRSTFWHAVEHGLWVGAALVFWWPVVGVDPTPHPWRYPTRLLALFLAMPPMSFLAIAIFTATEPLYPTYATSPEPWGPQALADQREAAALMWVVGTLAMVAAMLAVAAAWKGDDEARQRRLEARIDAGAVSE